MDMRSPGGRVPVAGGSKGIGSACAQALRAGDLNPARSDDRGPVNAVTVRPRTAFWRRDPPPRPLRRALPERSVPAWPTSTAAGQPASRPAPHARPHQSASAATTRALLDRPSPRDRCEADAPAARRGRCPARRPRCPRSRRPRTLTDQMVLENPSRRHQLRQRLVEGGGLHRPRRRAVAAVPLLGWLRAPPGRRGPGPVERKARRRRGCPRPFRLASAAQAPHRILVAMGRAALRAAPEPRRLRLQTSEETGHVGRRWMTDSASAVNFYKGPLKRRRRGTRSRR